ncbi:MAG: hypothetical protein HYX27_12480 [Acidobacteria bacterium]|nr:hypothetical protein [Acidobacteriota bacterium]
MPSRVLTGQKLSVVEPVHWMTALGEPVNATASPNDPFSGRVGPGGSIELESAMQRIQVLERRIQELESELPRRTEAGRREGRAEGERIASAAAAEAMQPQVARLASSIGELATYRARFRRESEPELIKLALAVARKILRRELTVDPHSLLGVLKAALETINRSEVLCIRVSQDDAPIVSAQVAALGLPDPVEITGDRTLERGTVVVDTRRGQVDASIQTQLAEIENGFADRIATHKSQ